MKTPQKASPASRPRVSDAAVKAATGKDWTTWFRALDRKKANGLPHKEIVKILSTGLGLKRGWWCQMIAVEYGKARGARVVGQTHDARFQIGVQKSVNVAPATVWKFLFSPKGLGIWLAGFSKVPLKKGATSRGTNGATAEVRSLEPGKKIRLRYQPSPRKKTTTIQIYVEASATKTRVLFHQEGLGSAAERERMRKHWKAVVEKLSASLA